MSIRIKDINIVFSENEIIKNGNIVVHPYEITVFCGESGSGKTSLLNILGLLDIQNQYVYEWDNKKIEFNEYNEKKRTQISYVFQDYNMIDDLSVIDNFKIMFNVAGLKYSKERTKELLNLVSIDKRKLRQKSRSLSGGEKQRIAIALALVKEPSLLLLDEPTANLDEDNATDIINILQELKKQGLMIVIASHHPELYKADHIYVIEDSKLIEEKYSETNKEKVIKENKKRKKFNPFAYSFMNITKHIIIYVLLIFAIFYSFGEMIFTNICVTNLLSQTQDGISKLIDTEIFVKNDQVVVSEESLGEYDTIGNPIDEKLIEELENMEYVESVYLYHKGNRLDDVYADGRESHYIWDMKDMITVGDVSIDSEKTLNEIINTATGEEEILLARCSKVDPNVEEGVFIPLDLANALGIEELNNTDISFNATISLGYLPGRFATHNTVTGQQSERMDINCEHFAFIPVTYKIKGIYENFENYYTNLTGFHGLIIYLDYHLYEDLQADLLNDEEYLLGYDSWMSYLMFYVPITYKNASSTCIVRVNDVENIPALTELIEKYGDYYTVITPEDQIKEVNKIRIHEIATLLFQPMILYGISMLLIVLLFIYSLKRRKKEFALIQANGIKHVSKTTLIDLVYLYICVIPLLVWRFVPSLLLSYYWARPGYYNDKEYYDKLAIITVIFGIVLFLILLGICYWVEKLYFKKLNIVQELRSK